MAVTPLGNVIYTNQNTPVASSVQQANQQRLDFQNVIASELAKDEEDKVQETAPPEEPHALDPDRQSQEDKQEKDEQEASEKEQTQEQNSSNDWLSYDDEGNPYIVG